MICAQCGSGLLVSTGAGSGSRADLTCGAWECLGCGQSHPGSGPATAQTIGDLLAGRGGPADR
jgi:hypothetical protein